MPPSYCHAASKVKVTSATFVAAFKDAASKAALSAAFKSSTFQVSGICELWGMENPLFTPALDHTSPETELRCRVVFGDWLATLIDVVLTATFERFSMRYPVGSSTSPVGRTVQATSVGTRTDIFGL